MNEITQIDVLPCRDVVSNAAIVVTGGPLESLEIVKSDGTPYETEVKSVAKDEIGQDVVVGDVLWWHGKFCLVDGLDVTLNKAHLDNAIGNWTDLSDAIRCPRPGELMTHFDGSHELLEDMLADGAKFVEPIDYEREYPWWTRSPDCTWRKPHPGAELKDLVHRGPAAHIEPIPNAIGTPAFVNLSADAQAECVGY